jgi:hypothetical protein
MLPSGFAQKPNPKAEYGALLQVVSPDPNAPASGYILTNDRRVSIRVTFTEPVNLATLIAGKSVLLRFRNDPPAAIQLGLSNDKRVLLITTRKPVDELGTYKPDLPFSLTLKGNSLLPSGAVGPVIKSVKGRVLDGNKDFKDGGDFRVTFWSVG